MRVVWTEAAIADLVEIRDYIERDDPSAAARVAASIVESVDMLATDARLGRRGRVSGTRELLISQTPYIVPYRIRDERIELLRVVHGRRQWPDDLE